MDFFTYKDQHLHAENVALTDIAKEVPTPFYVYSTATMTRHYTVFDKALHKTNALICFAVKANSNQGVLSTLAGLGAGADVVSGGELARALQAGIPAHKIVFSGVGKSKTEIILALRAGIKQINVESIPELDRIQAVAFEMGVTAPVALRVNPDVDAGTHEKITTGRKENKFGIEWADAAQLYQSANAMDGIRCQGIAMHIGSQLMDLAPFREAYTRAADLVTALRTSGQTVDTLDIGGGLGIVYGEDGEGDAPDIEAYAAVIHDCVGDLDLDLVVEPGRMIMGNAGILVAKIEYVKKTTAKTFVILDAGMNDLIRPTLYDAYHHIISEKEPESGVLMENMDVVGPICESGDTFGKDRPLPPVHAGDLLVMRTAGAYGAVQSGTYNTRPLVAEVMVKGDQWSVVRERVDVEDIIALDALPSWLQNR